MERFQSQQGTWLGFDPLVTPVEGVSIHRNTRLGETLSIEGNTIVYYMLLTPRRSRRPSINNGAAAPPRGSEVQAWRELPLLPDFALLGGARVPAAARAEGSFLPVVTPCYACVQRSVRSSVL